MNEEAPAFESEGLQALREALRLALTPQPQPRNDTGMRLAMLLSGVIAGFAYAMWLFGGVFERAQ